VRAKIPWSALLYALNLLRNESRNHHLRNGLEMSPKYQMFAQHNPNNSTSLIGMFFMKLIEPIAVYHLVGAMMC